MAINIRAGGFVPLTKSLVSAPYLILSGIGFEDQGYPCEERSYTLLTKNKNQNLGFSIFTSKNTPLINIPLVIRGWGNSMAELVLTGEKVKRGKNFTKKSK